MVPWFGAVPVSGRFRRCYTGTTTARLGGAAFITAIVQTGWPPAAVAVKNRHVIGPIARPNTATLWVVLIPQPNALPRYPQAQHHGNHEENDRGATGQAAHHRPLQCRGGTSIHHHTDTDSKQTHCKQKGCTSIPHYTQCALIYLSHFEEIQTYLCLGWGMLQGSVQNNSLLGVGGGVLRL